MFFFEFGTFFMEDFMEIALAIISIVVGLVSIGLAIFSMVTTSRTEKRIIQFCKKNKKINRWKGGFKLK